MTDIIPTEPGPAAPFGLLNELLSLRAELAEAKEALKPFAGLRVTRFMTDGIRYEFRVDAAWIRKARAVGGMED